jgi:Putative cyclase
MRSIGIFTRGLLIDVPRLKGVPYLNIDGIIQPEDLDAWERQRGVRVESGDVLLVRTGRGSLPRSSPVCPTRRILGGIRTGVAR